MKRIGHDSRPNSATNPTSSPRVIGAGGRRATRRPAAGASSRTTGSASIAGVERRPHVAAGHPLVAQLLAPAPRGVRPRRPRVRASSRPARRRSTRGRRAETSPIRSWARVAGPSIRCAKFRFMIASAGNSRAPTSARYGSARSSAISAKIVSAITPTANGTGQYRSTAAFTSASMCASSSPVGVSRWYCSASSR